MDSSTPVPRVNMELLQNHINKRVKLVCKLERTEAGSLVVTACDGGTVYVKPSGTGQYDGAVLEIEGTVLNPTTMQEVEVSPFGSDNFDMASYNELVKLSNSQYSYLFA